MPLAAPLTSVAPWFGAKRSLAPIIAQELGPHRAYCEPFCGSLAVLFALEPCSMEIANDLHGDLINLVRVLASPHYPDLAQRVARTLMAHELYRESAAMMTAVEDAASVPIAAAVAAVNPEHVERAYWFLVCAWQGRNGVTGVCKTSNGAMHLARRFTLNGGHASTRWRGVAESIPAWHERLRGVMIDRMDAFELLAKLDDTADWAIYCDPPYLVKSKPYTHDFAPADHRRLAELLRRFRHARVVVSYYDHPDLADLYPADRWTIRRLPVTKNMANTAKRDTGGKTEAVECLILNGPSFAEPSGESLFETSRPHD